jgi:beta-glucosidase/6-phospho-beta-glucosidase/beta-galactosidase
MYLNTTYPTPGGIVFTETGWSSFEATQMTTSQARVDLGHTLFYLPLLNEILKSIHEDGVKFSGLFGWSLVDNWEWGTYGPRFGVQLFNNVTLERSYKRSIFDFVDFITGNTEK